MTLILWKAPVVRMAEEAEALLKPFYEREDDGAFEPSPAIARVGEALEKLYPDDLESNESPWGEPIYRSDRLLVLDLRWGADNLVIEVIEELAREHGLVLYDPQGPDVHLPTDPVEPEPMPPPGRADHLKTFAMLVPMVAIFAAGWYFPVRWIGWILMIVGGFLTSVVIFLIYILVFAPKDDPQ